MEIWLKKWNSDDRSRMKKLNWTVDEITRANMTVFINFDIPARISRNEDFTDKLVIKFIDFNEVVVAAKGHNKTMPDFYQTNTEVPP